MTLPPSLTKETARKISYKAIHSAKAARFPFPIEGRIPNFVGAEAAAQRLRELPEYQKARAIKVNPDAPQLPVRAMALRDGKSLIMPSPRLRSTFLLIDPRMVPQGEERKAASLSHCGKYGRELSIEELAPGQAVTSIDLVVAGSVAVTRNGGRAGKGEGYADMEYAILRELGHPEIPVVTTVHTAQIVPEFELDAHDLVLDYIITPDEVVATNTPYPKPSSIAWELLDEEALREMPVLAELRKLRWETQSTPDILQPGLAILFVGINPGRASAAQGHNFAGPGNHFWRLLHESGLTPVQYSPNEEQRLLQHGLGITNLVSRASRGEDDLSWDEFIEGGRELRMRVGTLKPKIVALLGKNVFRGYAGLTRSAKVDWGLQAGQDVQGVYQFVAPNPSARSTISYSTRLAYYKELRELMGRI